MKAIIAVLVLLVSFQAYANLSAGASFTQGHVSVTLHENDAFAIVLKDALVKSSLVEEKVNMYVEPGQLYTNDVLSLNFMSTLTFDLSLFYKVGEDTMSTSANFANISGPSAKKLFDTLMASSSSKVIKNVSEVSVLENGQNYIESSLSCTLSHDDNSKAHCSIHLK